MKRCHPPARRHSQRGLVIFHVISHSPFGSSLRHCVKNSLHVTARCATLATNRSIIRHARVPAPTRKSQRNGKPNTPASRLSANSCGCKYIIRASGEINPSPNGQSSRRYVKLNGTTPVRSVVVGISATPQCVSTFHLPGRIPRSDGATHPTDESYP